MILLLLLLLGGVLALWIAFVGLSRRVDELERFAREIPMTVPLVPPQSDGHAREKAPAPAQSTPAPSTPIPLPFDTDVRRPPATLEGLVQRPTTPAPTPVTAKPLSVSSSVAETVIRPIEPEPGIGAEVTEMARKKPAAPVTEEWEAVIGGNWLNKAGVLVFVIGVALFVGYSLTELGPTGRVAVGLAAGVSMLVSGVMLEARKGYAVYGRGLIGGGWAALYFTTYAAHGLAAARIIQNPIVATALLLSVAAGIILHSLRYRSQIVTGLAYFVGFATLAITEMTGFAVIASVPLAASLLIVARSFEWDGIALMGVIVTYGTYAFSIAGQAPSWSGFLTGESVVAMYWLMFECFALLTIRANEKGLRALSSFALFAINSCGFVGVSIMQWTSAIPIYVFLAAGGALFVADSAIRGALTRSSVEPREMTPERLYEPGYEASVTIGLALASAAIFERFSGLTLNVAMLLEGEVVLIAGVALGLRYLRFLAALILAIPAAKLLLVDQFGPRAESLASFSLNDHSAVAILTAAVLFLDRALERAQWRIAFSYAGWLVVTVLIGFEAPVDYLGLGWLLLAGCMFEIGLLIQADDFRGLGYATGFLGSSTILVVSLFPITDATPHGQKIALAAASVLIYLAATQTHYDSNFPEGERTGARDICLGLGAAFVATLAWYVLPVPLLAVGWAILALAQVELGVALGIPALTACGSVTSVLAYGRLYFANFTTAGETFGISHRLLTVIPLIAVFYYLANRMRAQAHNQLDNEDTLVSRQLLWGASLLVVVLMRFELGRVLAVAGWSAFVLVLLATGIWLARPDLRWQSYVLALVTFMRGWATNFYVPGMIAGLPARLATAGVVIAAFYAAELISPRIVKQQTSAGSALREELDWLDRNARMFFSILATLLLTALLYNEVSSKALTAAWSMEGASLLALGFVLRERVLRLSALMLLIGCVLKVFAYDLNNLETLARIFSFIVLGLLLLVVSFLYTHHYARFKKYL